MEFRKTIVFVTHSIEESVLLADRVVVMTYRPARSRGSYRFPFPIPATRRLYRSYNSRRS